MMLIKIGEFLSIEDKVIFINIFRKEYSLKTLCQTLEISLRTYYRNYKNLNKDDVILMCSDGLSNMIEDEEIRMIMQGQRDIVEKAESLVKAANNNGGKDNIAVVLVEPFAEEGNR